MSTSRDFIGYGQHRPNFKWPQGSGLAINFVINYETGAERSPADGDNESEGYLNDIPGSASLSKKRHLSAESNFEYGSRCGIWRLHRLFDAFNLPVTVFACGRALVANPEYASYLKESQHEVAGHGYQWIDYNNVPVEIERQHIKQTINIIEDMTQKQVFGWYTGRKSASTLELIAETDLIYQSDSYADDLPYWISLSQKPQLIIPYTLVTNDFRYGTSPGFCCNQDFFLELKAAFDFQYAESQDHPQLLTIGLHGRFSGRPSRAHAIKCFLEYIAEKDNIWTPTRALIAEFYHREMQVKL